MHSVSLVLIFIYIIILKVSNVFSLPCSSTKTLIASASSDNTIKIWDIYEGSQCYLTLGSHTSTVHQIVFTQDGSKLFSASADFTVKMWDVNTGACLQTMVGHTDWVTTIDISSDGKWVVTGGKDKKLIIWDVSDGKQIKLITAGQMIWRLKLSPDGALLCAGSYALNQGVVEIYNTQTGLLVKKIYPQTEDIESFAFSSDGNYLVTGSQDKTIKIIDVNAGFAIINTLNGHTGIVKGLAVSPDNMLLVSCSDDKSIIIWNFQTGLQIKTLTSHTDIVRAVSFTQDGKYFLSASLDKTIIIWSATSFTSTKTLTHSGAITDVRITNKCPNCLNAVQGGCPNCYCDCQVSLIFSLPVLGECSAGKVNTCKTCLNIGYYFQGALCYTCPTGCNKCVDSTLCNSCSSGYYLAAGKCCAIENCIDCSLDSCNRCQNSLYRLSTQLNTYVECKACNLDGEYIDDKFPTLDGTGICLKHSFCQISYCQKCSNLYTQCSLCEALYYLDVAMSNKVCTSCLQAGRFILGKECLVCPANCDSCKNQTFCEKCSPVYYLRYLKTIQSTGICSGCNNLEEYVDENFSSTDGTGVCLRYVECTIPNCLKCANKYSMCAFCAEKYYLSNFNNNSSCTSCDSDGYFIQGKLCLSCPVSCLKCTKETSCDKCSSGSFLQYKTSDLSIICTSCDTQVEYIDGKNSSPDGTGICLIHSYCKITNCKKCVNKYAECSLCEAGYYLDTLNSNKSCITCNNQGFFIQGILCVPCPQNCDICESDSICKKCLSGLFLIFGMASPPVCSDCRATGYYVDINYSTLDGYGLCLKHAECLILNCEKCSNKFQQCVLCKTGLYLYNQGKADICSKCDGVGLFIEGVRCLNCTENCERCASREKCLICRTGYFIDSGNCALCFKNCVDCLSASSCKICQNNFYLSASSPQVDYYDACVSACDRVQGYFLDSKANACHICASLIKNCIQCESDSSCFECQEGFYLKSSIEQTSSYQNCIATCPENFTLVKLDTRKTLACEKCFTHEGKCVNSCPDHFFGNNTSRFCESCHATCSKCTGATKSDCLECDSTRILRKNLSNSTSGDQLLMGECACKPKFYDDKNFNCRSCHISCASCSGPGFLDCLTCASNRGDSKNYPFYGKCKCPSNFIELLEETCRDNQQYALTASMISAQEETIKYTTITSLFGFRNLRVIGSLFNLIDVAQEINLYGFLNIGYPLNLENFLEFLSNFRFYKHFKFFEFEKFDINASMIELTAHVHRNTSESAKIFITKGISFSFLSNCLSTLIIVLFVPLFALIIFRILEFINKRTEINEEGEIGAPRRRCSCMSQIISITLVNKRFLMSKIISLLFLGSLQEIHLFAVLQFMKYSDDNWIDKINLACSVLWILVEALILYYASRSFFRSNPEISYSLAAKINRKSRFISGLKTETSISSQKLGLTLTDKKLKYPFLFDSFLREDKFGMSYILYKGLKKIILTTIYTAFSENVDQAITVLILAYFLFYMYLRVIQPFTLSMLNITSELTELGHIGFFLALKYYALAVDLKNSELALSLGVYLIYAVVFLISMNTAFMAFNILMAIYEKFIEFIRKIKTKSKQTIMKQSKEPSIIMVQQEIKDPNLSNQNLLGSSRSSSFNKEKEEMINLVQSIVLENYTPIEDQPLEPSTKNKEEPITYYPRQNLIEMTDIKTLENKTLQDETRKRSLEAKFDSLKKFRIKKLLEQERRVEKSPKRKTIEQQDNDFFDQLGREFVRIREKYKEPENSIKNYRKQF